MAAGDSSEAQDEAEKLLKEDEKVDDGGSTKKKERKLVLYHWTQSFSSQKVRDVR